MKNLVVMANCAFLALVACDDSSEIDTVEQSCGTKSTVDFLFFVQHAPTDEGNGYISYLSEGADDTGGAYSALTLANCESGEAHLLGSSNGWLENQKIVEIEDLVAFSKIARSTGQLHEISSLKAAANSSLSNYYFKAMSFETDSVAICACTAFYPEFSGAIN